MEELKTYIRNPGFIFLTFAITFDNIKGFEEFLNCYAVPSLDDYDGDDYFYFNLWIGQDMSDEYLSTCEAVIEKAEPEYYLRLGDMSGIMFSHSFLAFEAMKWNCRFQDEDGNYPLEGYAVKLDDYCYYLESLYRGIMKVERLGGRRFRKIYLPKPAPPSKT
jgi:hypothetical protein